MVSHEMGSSAARGVRLRRVMDSVSVSNSKVKRAPGGVQVPTTRWCFMLLLFEDIDLDAEFERGWDGEVEYGVTSVVRQLG